MATQQVLVCDSCGKSITDMNNRVYVLIFTPEPIADPQLDLCLICAKGVIDDPKVKKANETAKARGRQPAQRPVDYTGAPENLIAPQTNRDDDDASTTQ